MSVKNQGQVFTPDYIIDMILDTAHYYGKKILNQKILEPSFGDGRILTKIIDRFINEGIKENFSYEIIKEKLEENIYGIELDTELYKKGQVNIVKHIFDKIGLYADINLYRSDTLRIYNGFLNYFDYVVGNPPYVNIHNIEDKDTLKSLRFTKSGMSDLYLAFYEAGIDMLNSTGKLCFIAPNAWMFNKAGKDMREYITLYPILSKIINFGHKQIFEGFTTYTSITLIDKRSTYGYVEYELYESREKTRTIKYDDLWVGNRFCFDDKRSLIEYREIEKLKFSDFCTVKNGYATLCDNFFINNKDIPDNEYMIDVCKASVLKRYRCFYPYDKDGKFISEDKLKGNKILWKYLERNKEKLKKRANDKNSPWWCFGRTQGISDTYKKKFAVSSIYKTIDDIKIQECEEGVGVYGGLYIVCNCNIKEIEKMLKTEKFMKYVRSLGLLKNGGYYTITSKQLQNYLNYIFLTEYLKEGVEVFYKFTFGEMCEKIRITDKEINEYGINYDAVAEDNCEASFKLSDIGDNVFLKT